MAKRRKLIDFDSKRLYYSIKEVADHFAVNVSLLRFWEGEFENINPKKTASGTRQYTKDDIMQVEVVYHLVKEKKMTLGGARQLLKTKKDEQEKRIIVIEKLNEIKTELLQHSLRHRHRP